MHPEFFAKHILQNKITPEGFDFNLQKVKESLTRLAFEPTDEDFNIALKKQDKIKAQRQKKKKIEC